RICLEHGQRLDINQLRRDGNMPRDLSDSSGGTLSVKYPTISFEQEIRFTSRPRHYGGRQYYFECPITGRLASVLYRPPGAKQFASRRAWRNVAYATQFAEATSRAHMAKAKICRQLGSVDEWDDFPPKPRWMRWKTYERWRERYQLQEKRLDDALLHAWRTRWVHLSSPTDFESIEPRDVDDLLDLVNSGRA